MTTKKNKQKPIPVDMKLYNKIKKNIYKKNPKHSAYRSGLIVQEYKKKFKEKYGKKSPYLGKKTVKKGLKRWFDEKWVNQRGEVGYKYKHDIYRPSHRITKNTPTTHKELTRKQIKRARKEKYRTGRVKRFKKGGAKIYDFVIVGGGISGLYLQYKLLKKNKKVLLIEQNNRLGGRIYTYHTKLNNKRYSMEAGAGRFSKNHKQLLKLIKECNLTNKIIKIPSKVDYIPVKNTNNNIKYNSPYDCLNEIVKSNRLTKDMNKLSFEQWVQKKYSREILSYLKAGYPYKDIFKANAYDALNLYKKDLTDNNEFYVLNGGLSQIIDCLRKAILKLNGKISTKTKVLDISRKNDDYLIKTTKKNCVCNNVIFTGQKPSLLKIPFLKKCKSLIDTIRNANLCRYYFIFDTKKCAWFKNIKKTITDSTISYFIPINYETGLVMLSYVDEHNATYLNNLEKKSSQKLINYLLKEAEKIFNIKNIPKPLWFKSFYWDSGVGNWKVGVDSKEIEKKITKPYDKENIYICGENYSSEYQSWIEGALITSNNVLKKLKFI